MTATMQDTRLTGQMLIAGSPVWGSGRQIYAFDPSTGRDVEPAFHHGDPTHVDAACAAAAAAFAEYRSTTSEQRAQFLEAIAANIEAITDAVVARDRRNRTAASPHHRRSRPYHGPTAAVRRRSP